MRSQFEAGRVLAPVGFGEVLRRDVTAKPAASSNNRQARVRVFITVSGLRHHLASPFAAPAATSRIQQHLACLLRRLSSEPSMISRSLPCTSRDRLAFFSVEGHRDWCGYHVGVRRPQHGLLFAIALGEITGIQAAKSRAASGESQREKYSIAIWSLGASWPGPQSNTRRASVDSTSWARPSHRTASPADTHRTRPCRRSRSA